MLDQQVRVARVGDVPDVDAAQVARLAGGLGQRGAAGLVLVDEQLLACVRAVLDVDHLRALAGVVAVGGGQERDLVRVGRIADVHHPGTAAETVIGAERRQVRVVAVRRDVRDPAASCRPTG
ncbi:MAG: hypothetical protein ACRDT6_00935 [Micromonosporaceae bacterium]